MKISETCGSLITFSAADFLFKSQLIIIAECYDITEYYIPNIIEFNCKNYEVKALNKWKINLNKTGI